MQRVRRVNNLQGSASTTVGPSVAASAPITAVAINTTTPFSGGGAAVGRTERMEVSEQAEVGQRTDVAVEARFALSAAMGNHLFSNNAGGTRTGFGPQDMTGREALQMSRPLTVQQMAMVQEGRDAPLYGGYTNGISSVNIIFARRNRNPTGDGGTGPVGSSDTKPRGSGNIRTELEADRNSLEVTVGRSSGTAIPIVMATPDENTVRVFYVVVKDNTISTNANNIRSFNGEFVTFTAINALTLSELDMFGGPGFLTSMDIDCKVEIDDTEAFEAWLKEEAKENALEMFQNAAGSMLERMPHLLDDWKETTWDEVAETTLKEWDGDEKRMQELKGKFATQKKPVVDHVKPQQGTDWDELEKHVKAQTEAGARKELDVLIENKDIKEIETVLNKITSLEKDGFKDVDAVREAFIECGGQSTMAREDEHSKRVAFLKSKLQEAREAKTERESTEVAGKALEGLQAALKKGKKDERTNATNEVLKTLPDPLRTTIEGLLRTQLKPGQFTEGEDGRVFVTHITQDFGRKFVENLPALFQPETESEPAVPEPEKTPLQRACAEIVGILYENKRNELYTYLHATIAGMGLSKEDISSIKGAMGIEFDLIADPPTTGGARKKQKLSSAWDTYTETLTDEKRMSINKKLLQLAEDDGMSESDDEGSCDSTPEDSGLEKAVEKLVNAYNATQDDESKIRLSEDQSLVVDLECELSKAGSDVRSAFAGLIEQQFSEDERLRGMLFDKLGFSDFEPGDVYFMQADGIITKLIIVVDVATDHSLFCYTVPANVLASAQNQGRHLWTSWSLQNLLLKIIYLGKVEHWDKTMMQGWSKFCFTDDPVVYAQLFLTDPKSHSKWVQAEYLAMVGARSGPKSMEFSNTVELIEDSIDVVTFPSCGVVQLDEKPTITDEGLVVLSETDQATVEDVKDTVVLRLVHDNEAYNVVVRISEEGKQTLELTDLAGKRFALSGTVKDDFDSEFPDAEMLSGSDGFGRRLVHGDLLTMLKAEVKEMEELFGVDIDLEQIVISDGEKQYRLTQEPFQFVLNVCNCLMGLSRKGDKAANDIVRMGLSRKGDKAANDIVRGKLDNWSRAYHDFCLGGKQFTDALSKMIAILESGKNEVAMKEQLLDILDGQNVQNVINETDSEWLMKTMAQNKFGAVQEIMSGEDEPSLEFTKPLGKHEELAEVFQQKLDDYYEEPENQHDLKKIVADCTETGILMAQALVESRYFKDVTHALSFIEEYSVTTDVETAHGGFEKNSTSSVCHQGSSCLDLTLGTIKREALAEVEGQISKMPGLDSMGTSAGTINTEFLKNVYKVLLYIAAKGVVLSDKISVQEASGDWPTGESWIVDPSKRGAVVIEGALKENDEADPEFRPGNQLSEVLGRARDYAHSSEGVLNATRKLYEATTAHLAAQKALHTCKQREQKNALKRQVEQCKTSVDADFSALRQACNQADKEPDDEMQIDGDDKTEMQGDQASHELNEEIDRIFNFLDGYFASDEDGSEDDSGDNDDEDDDDEDDDDEDEDDSGDNDDEDDDDEDDDDEDEDDADEDGDDEDDEDFD